MAGQAEQTLCYAEVADGLCQTKWQGRQSRQVMRRWQMVGQAGRQASAVELAVATVVEMASKCCRGGGCRDGAVVASAVERLQAGKSCGDGANVWVHIVWPDQAWLGQPRVRLNCIDNDRVLRSSFLQNGSSSKDHECFN
eukprot:1162051-Pelagomonas_calceolata.AAC.2